MRAQPSIHFEMDWHTVPGWFSDEDADCYRAIVANTPNAGEIFEIGCWVGRSSCCLIGLVQESGKRITLNFVDNFVGVPEHHGIPRLYDASIENEFRKNIKSTEYRFTCHVWVADSVAVSRGVLSGSLDAVFIDGDHSYESVKADINAWLPKVHKGGIIAGHDYQFPEVADAVDDVFSIVEEIGDSWLFRL